MDDLRIVIQSLEKAEAQDFERFIQRYKYVGNRKDLRLFRLMRADKIVVKEELLVKLSLKNLNAYHTLRKRLYKDLSEFLLESESSEDERHQRARNHLNLARHLFGRSVFQLGWKFLGKAEFQSRQNGFYDVLSQVYLTEFQYFSFGSNKSFSELEKLYEKNNEFLDSKNQILISKSRITHLVQKSKLKGEPVDFSPVLSAEFSGKDLEKTIYSSPEALLDYLESVKKTAHVSKSYFGLQKTLKTYIEKCPLDLPDSVKIQLNYLLAHTYYRNKEFEASYNLCQETRLILEENAGPSSRKLERKLKPLICANLVFLGRVEDSIATLKPQLDDKHLSLKERTNVTVILGIYNFLAGHKETSFELLKELKHSERYYMKELGVEWTLKKCMMEVILFFELDKKELALSRIRSIERKYKTFLEHHMYRRVSSYLALMKGYINGKYERDKWLGVIANSWKWIPAEREDIQAMLFYCWLKSKLLDREFYDVALETVNLD